MKKVLKITIILMMIFTIFAQVSNVYASYGKGTDGSGGGGQTSSSGTGGQSINPGEWDPSQYREPSNGGLLESRAKIITTVIRSVGIVLSVIILMIIGIKEMTASVEEKSMLKKAMPGYILGAIMVFAITVIPTVLYEIANDIF